MGHYSGRHREASKRASPLITVGLASLLITGLLLACVFLGARQFVLLQYYDQLQAVEEELVVLESEVRQLKWTQNAIEADPFYAERVARERMNYSAPGEVIFRFESAD
jgi:cell division protein FtsB